MLIKRWRYSILITAATFLIVLTSPVIAAFDSAIGYTSTSFNGLIQINPNFFKLTPTEFQLSNFNSDNLDNSNYSTNEITIADTSILSTKQEQASEVLHQLNLTSEQEQQIKKIHHKYKRQLFRKRNSLIVLQQQLSDLMVSTKPTNLIRAKNQQLVDLRQEIGELKFESMLATREILTPQQRQKFREIMESQ